ncbi:ABC transporter family protein [Tritrichomonas foetus]|uniref:ABC transporter family protein n=1 Tax=Tritrichomonas foetus TaxID=1144522 RepID=A0A1J4J627_9EUKA|nr:ABC transporter family protein [Tritrichomonas foetus]|eukprot:OHS94664.1 ABC transporter family protein [Tritrichomonas foetus]
MPPPGNTSVFKQQGSLDDMVERKGNEFLRMMKYFSNKAILIFTYLFAIIAGALPLLMSVFMGDMTNSFGTSGSIMPGLTKVIYKMIYFQIGNLVATALNFLFRTIANPYFMRDIRKNLYHSYMEQDIEYYDQVPTGVMVGRISQDATMIHEIFIDKICTTVQNLAQSIGGIILALVTIWECGLVGIGCVILSCIVYLVGEKAVDKIWVQYNQSSSEAANKAEEVMTSFRTIKSFDCELKEAENYKKSLTEVDKVFRKTSLVQGVKEFFISLILNGMTAGVLYYASYLIIRQPQKGYQAGDLFIILMSLSFATMGFSQAMTISDDVKKTLVSCAKVLDVIEREPKMKRKEGKNYIKVAEDNKHKIKSIQGKIEFRDVTFKYATAKNNAIEHLSFIINPGETVAFVGESGCGKSTTLQLIQRFYEIDSGQIFIDDVDVRELSPEFVRSQISIVPQSPVMFTMNIADNIAYGSNDVADKSKSKNKKKNDPRTREAEIAQSAQVGNAHNFIMEIPNNYQALVQQTSLSGGQKQRICISRAIMKNSPVLLLDEATAALDTESELLVQQSLEQFRKGKTAIMVAHRLATVINADRILVFQEGHIVEEGTHQELLTHDGIYADLVKFQLQ